MTMADAATALDLRQARERPPEPRGTRAYGAAVAVVTVLAAVTYLWGIGERPSAIQAYYAAAVRTMSESWSAFWWGGLDPAGFMSVDKVPGGLWLQALSVRLFGHGDLAQLLPQALVMAGCVPLTYLAVRRWAGPAAGLVAAVVLATTPVWTVLARINAPDVYLMICLLAAAYCAAGALRDGRGRGVVLAGLWIGLAFQAKMVQALILLVVLVAVHLACAPRDLRVRLAHAAGAAGATLAVCLVWPLTVALTPSGSRPYLDGSATDSVWEMLVLYNGVGRVLTAGRTGTDPAPLTGGGAAGPLRLFNPEHVTQIGWLLPAALIALAAGLFLTRRAVRTDPDRAGWLLWGGWLLAYGVAISFATGVHPYYSSSLAPAVAALTGAGAVTAVRLWQRPSGASSRLLLPLLIGVTTLWAVFLLRAAPTAPFWLAAAIGTAGAAALFLLVVSRLSEFGGEPINLLGIAIAGVAALMGPVVWSVATLDRPTSEVGAFFAMIEPVAGPSDYEAKASAMLKVNRPLRPEELRRAEAALLPAIPRADPALHDYLERQRGGERYLMATTGAELAAPYIARYGSAVLPMGGFTGGGPQPGVRDLAGLVGRGEVRFVLAGGYGGQSGMNRARLEWVRASCEQVDPSAYQATRNPQAPVLYDCDGVS